MVMSAAKIGIVAALEREVRPLVKGWRVETLLATSPGGRRFKFFEGERAVLVCGGIGAQAARRAAEAVVARGTAQLIISAGFAGALTASLHVGGLFTPAEVIDAASGKRYATQFGSGVLVTASQVLRKQEKVAINARYGAQAVDMEAAAVAEVAQARGIPFLAVKAISEEEGFPIPPVEKFVDEAGEFHTGRFIAYTALRPATWPALRALAANTALASRNLCAVLAQMIQRDDLGKMNVQEAGLVAGSLKLNR